jgi:hypothetical protein
VRRHSRLDERRLVVLSSADGLEISSIPSGILFVMATWSVQALSSFRHLNEVLSRLDLGALKVFVVDIDDFATELVRQLPGLVLGGYGETFWIRGGAISYALSHCNSQLAGVVEDYTRAIVGEASHPG